MKQIREQLLCFSHSYLVYLIGNVSWYRVDVSALN